MDICLIGKPSLDTASKPKRAPKQKKVETVNSDSDSEFGVPKKTAPKGEDHLCVTVSAHSTCRAFVSSTHGG